MAKLRYTCEDVYIDLYDPEGYYLGTTNNELAFNDFRLQVIEENKKANGKIENGYENYPFHLYTTQLAKILTEGPKNDK